MKGSPHANHFALSTIEYLQGLGYEVRTKEEDSSLRVGEVEISDDDCDGAIAINLIDLFMHLEKC